MSGRSLFIDTAFVQALYNQADAMHLSARAWAPALITAAKLWTTEAVLVEIGNALGGVHRTGALAFIEQAYQTPNMTTVSVDTALLLRATQLYRDRGDKQWGMTDCISFVVMGEHHLTEALTADRHFAQAGFVLLMLAAPKGK